MIYMKKISLITGGFIPYLILKDSYFTNQLIAILAACTLEKED